MSPDKQRLMEDIHKAYYRIMELADSMELIRGTNQDMIEEAQQSMIHAVACLEDALAVSEEPRRDIIATRQYVENAQRQLNRTMSDNVRNLQ